jgi:hypothetical protein
MMYKSKHYQITHINYSVIEQRKKVTAIFVFVFHNINLFLTFLLGIKLS